MKKKKWYKKISNWFFILLLILIIPILFIFSIVLIKTINHPDKIPDFFGYKPMIMMFDTMEPDLSIGDLVVVKNINYNKLNNQDIIAIRTNDDKVVIGRIIGNDDVSNDYIIRGDNSSYDTGELANETNFEGIYAFKIAGLGDLLLFLQQPIILISCIMLILLGGLLWFFIQEALDKKQKTLYPG